MSKFALQRIEAVVGKQVFTKLVINRVCQFDTFESEVINEGKYDLELGKIYAYMDEIANNRLLPQKKFRAITITKTNVKEYEFKSKNLRVYAIKSTGGKTIVLGGYKRNQKKDLKKFRAIKKRYLESLK